ncbi:CE1759 family FMN reductase [Actinomyces vulturis]|uniref:CE1759 family FMN reductase n=1 Tax=Actinomyces vulturis TaxID=1857645 RepID=UPI00083701C5|nr:CE1759 family FMN reductase [Actinomyces vulturis]
MSLTTQHPDTDPTVKIAVINAGMSTPSSTQLLAQRVTRALQERAHEFSISLHIEDISLRPLAMDITAVHLNHIPLASVDHALEVLEGADAVVALSPVYAGSYSGVFKMFADLIGNERLMGTPVLIGATGGSARHSLMLDYAMRPLMTALRASVVPTGIFAATADFGDSYGTELTERISRATYQLLTATMTRVDAVPGLAPASAQVTTVSANDPTAVTRTPMLCAHSQAAPTHGPAANTPNSTVIVHLPDASSPAPALTEGSSQSSSADEVLRQTGSLTSGNRGQIPILKANGASGRFAPDLDDYVPMDQLLPQ